jgi:hypothetical protein
VFAFLDPNLVFSLSFSCVLVDIVPVSSEQLVGVDQEQVFEEEPQCLSKEGKWTSPPAYSIFVPHNLHDN